MFVSNNNKLECFEYLTLKLVDISVKTKHRSLQHFLCANDFSRLKILKLLFFVTAVNCEKDNLLDIFNKFYALPYGHVESDIYDAIKDHKLKRFIVDSSSLSIKDDYYGNNLSIEVLCNSFDLQSNIKAQINHSTLKLFRINPDIINYSAMQLVELSHIWFSWRSSFQNARQDGQFRAEISPELIKLEPKFFFI